MDLLEKFIFPDIPGQSYPVHAVGKSGRLVNFKSIIYPSPTSTKRYTRARQLKRRSQQAKIFDALINIGYFDPLTVYKEFPILIENSKRLPNMKSGLFWLLDYYFPELYVAIELDSDLHNEDKDSVRDEYLKINHGITVYRIKDLQTEKVQKTKFRDLIGIMKNLKKTPNPSPLIFTTDLLDRQKRI